jgi:hypothetical protein
MDDPEVAAAIAAGELDGLAAALDKYAGIPLRVLLLDGT